MAETAEQTRVALPWQQGEARGTLNLPASTKVEDLKLCLNASDCAAVMFDTVIIEVRVMRAGARHLLWCILGSQGAKHAALASCGVAGKPC